MAVARAGATNNHVVDGEIIFLSDIDGIRILKVLISLQFFISESVEAGEGDSQVGCLQQVLNLLAVWVEAGRVELDVGREDPVDDLALGGGSQAGVTSLTDDLTQRLGNSCRDSRSHMKPNRIHFDICYLRRLRGTPWRSPGQNICKSSRFFPSRKISQCTWRRAGRF